MGDLSSHFSHHDFGCACGECDPKEYKIHLGLVGALEAIEAHFQRPVRIVRGYMCEKACEKAGGGRKSAHRYGRAVHVRVDGVLPQEVFKFVQSFPEVRGLGLYPTEGAVHIDTRREDRTEWVKEGVRYTELTDEVRSKYGLN